eukprot:12104010-Heterocapsa_arctica.AAC.1
MDLGLQEDDALQDLGDRLVSFDDCEEADEHERSLVEAERMLGVGHVGVHLLGDRGLFFFPAFRSDLKRFDSLVVVKDEGEAVGVEVDASF